MANERRRSLRQNMRLEAMIFDLDGSMVGPCKLMNVSVSGAKLILQAPLEVPDCFLLVLSRKGGVQRQCDVIWRLGASVGIRFAVPAVAEDQEVSFATDTLTRISSRH
jgi:hypothetical protein